MKNAELHIHSFTQQTATLLYHVTFYNELPNNFIKYLSLYYLVLLVLSLGYRCTTIKVFSLQSLSNTTYFTYPLWNTYVYTSYTSRFKHHAWLLCSINWTSYVAPVRWTYWELNLKFSIDKRNQEAN